MIASPTRMLAISQSSATFASLICSTMPLDDTEDMKTSFFLFFPSNSWINFRVAASLTLNATVDQQTRKDRMCLRFTICMEDLLDVLNTNDKFCTHAYTQKLIPSSMCCKFGIKRNSSITNHTFPSLFLRLSASLIAISSINW